MNKIMISYGVSDATSALPAMLRLAFEKTCSEWKLQDWELVFDKIEIDAGEVWNIEIENMIRESRYYVFLLSEKFLKSTFINQHEIPKIFEEIRRDPTKNYFHTKLFPCDNHPLFSNTQSLLKDNVPLIPLETVTLSELKAEVSFPARIEELNNLIFNATVKKVLIASMPDTYTEHTAVYDINRFRQKQLYGSAIKNKPSKIHFFSCFSSPLDEPESICITLPKSISQPTVDAPLKASVELKLFSMQGLFGSEDADFLDFLEAFNQNISLQEAASAEQLKPFEVMSTIDGLFGKLNTISRKVIHFQCTLDSFLCDESSLLKLREHLVKLADLTGEKLNQGKSIVIFINYQRDSEMEAPQASTIQDVVTKSIPLEKHTFLEILHPLTEMDLAQWLEQRLDQDELIKKQSYIQLLLENGQPRLKNVVANIHTKAKELLRKKYIKK